MKKPEYMHDQDKKMAGKRSEDIDAEK